MKKGQPRGARLIVSDRGCLLHFGSADSLGIQLKQKDSCGLFALLILLLQQLLGFCVPGDPWGCSSRSQHCHWDVVSWGASKEKDNLIPFKMEGTKAYRTSHWRNRHFHLFSGTKNCLISLRPLKSWLDSLKPLPQGWIWGVTCSIFSSQLKHWKTNRKEDKGSKRWWKLLSWKTKLEKVQVFVINERWDYLYKEKSYICSILSSEWRHLECIKQWSGRGF